jgi:hypothetical protein
MIAYEFYLLDESRGYQVIGVLPERRKNPERITQKSILKWGEKIFGNDLDTKDIFFIQVSRDEKNVKIFRPLRSASPRSK